MRVQRVRVERVERGRRYIVVRAFFFLGRFVGKFRRYIPIGGCYDWFGSANGINKNRNSGEKWYVDTQ